MILLGSRLVPASEIKEVDLTKLEHLVVYVRTDDYVVHLEGQLAIDFVMRWQPSALEGRRFKFARHAWAFHNLIAHPGLQILAWLGLHQLGFRLHDATIPRPKGRK